MLRGAASAALVQAGLTIVLLLSACSGEDSHGPTVDPLTGQTSNLTTSTSIPAPITPNHGDSDQGDGGGGSGASSMPVTAGETVTRSNSSNHWTVGSRVTLTQTSSSSTAATAQPTLSSSTRVYVTSRLQATPPVAAAASLATGVVVGIVIGVSIAVLVVSVALYMLMKRHKTGRYANYRMSNLARQNSVETEDPVTYRNDAFGAWKAYDDL